jgi:alpha-L-arabinofuranosidase
MKRRHAWLFYFIAVIIAGVAAFAASAATLTVQTDRPGAEINPAMWGIFFEDINFGADGGLYAELVKNRSFEFPDAMMGWHIVSSNSTTGLAKIRDDSPFDSANPHYLRIEPSAKGRFVVSNEGFRGMGVSAGDEYLFSVETRAASGAPSLEVELVSSNGEVLASTTLKKISDDWTERTATLKPKTTDMKAHLNLIVSGGAADVDMVSLFPKKTWKNRPGGLRADMVQLLADMKPGFLRFPGGCIVEGSQLDRRYQWKKTIGPIADRKLLINRWNYEFKHRPTPDYFQSFGLGFYEYFQLCEDIGAEPLPILNCGMACQFNTGQLVPLDKLDPYIQDALDLIEFANGPASSEWGAKRAAMGHSKPFHMKMLGVGNEQWGPQYLERYPIFAKAIKAKYPNIQLVSDAGPSPADDRFEFLWPKLKQLHADIVDQHCYANPLWFLANSHRYDDYDRNGPKVFMGEYAAQSVAIASPDNKNNLECALAEAAYMTGLERNADVVRMASYAPLFAHVDAWQWTPDLIWANNLHVYGTPNYYVQKLFSVNRGDEVLPVKLEAVDVPAAPTGKIGLGAYKTSVEFKDVSVTRGGDSLLDDDFSTDAAKWSTHGGRWDVSDGAFQQLDAKAVASATVGETSWGDYTVSLKARKTGGAEGFLIMVRYQNPENYIVWNLGSFDNKYHSIQARLAQQDELVSRVPGSIENGRWYDVKIQIHGTKMECFLDGKLVQSADVPPPQIQQLYATAARDEKSGEVILKVVNPGDTANETKINLAGAQKVAHRAKVTVLTGASGDDVNSFEAPRHIAPVTSELRIAGPEFQYQFPARSMTVLRIGSR